MNLWVVFFVVVADVSIILTNTEGILHSLSMCVILSYQKYYDIKTNFKFIGRKFNIISSVLELHHLR